MPKYCFALLLAASCAFAGPPTLRLGDNVRPVRYRASLTVIPQQDNFTGTIEIDLDVQKPTDIIWLNGRHLTIDPAKLVAGGHTLVAKTQTSGTEFIGFAFKSAIPVRAGPTAHRLSRQTSTSRAATDSSN